MEVIYIMELVEKFDNKRQFLNKTVERYKEAPGEYTQVVHLWIMNDKRRIFNAKKKHEKETFSWKMVCYRRRR